MKLHRNPWAVVPVKSLSRSKARLAPLLSGAERAGLVCTMMEDVLLALCRTEGLAGALVVTADREVAAIAQRAGARILGDEANEGITPAVTQAARHLASVGVGGMLVVPADVPLITRQDIEAILSATIESPSITLVPAIGDGGTNALLCRPPEAISFHFGDDSYSRHQQAARELGVTCRVLSLARVALDIDRPEDLVAFLAAPSPTRAYAYLKDLGIMARCAHPDIAESVLCPAGGAPS